MKVGSNPAGFAGACIFAIGLLSLASCGGGNGGSAPPRPPAAPTLSVGAGNSVKQLQFDWPSISGATAYKLFVSPGAVPATFAQLGGDLGAAATSVTVDVAVHRVDWVNARYYLQACNAAGCSNSSAISVTGAMLQAIGYFKASNTHADDFFGHAIALSADASTLAVGAPGEDSAATGIGGDQADDSAPEAGAVYVFVRTGSGWVQQAYIKASNTDANDAFGESVALSADGSTLAVGASEDSATTGIDGDQADDSAISAGAVYVYSRVGSTWSQQAYVKASNTGGSDGFGMAVALAADGSMLAVGAPGEGSAATGIGGDQGDDSAPGAGAVYVFARSANTWSQQAYIKASNAGAGDSFGAALAVDGEGATLAVGARGEASRASGIDGNQGDDSAPSAGAVYVFARTAGAWAQQAYVKASNTGCDLVRPGGRCYGDSFGAALALSADGNTLAVGAHDEDSAAIGIDGAQGDNSAAEAGAAYVYVRAAGTWSQQAYVKASNTDAGDSFGASLALNADGSALAIGAPAEDGSAAGVGGDATANGMPEAGAVYFYTRTGAAWTQRAYVKSSNTGPRDELGWSVCLSADAQTLAASALGEAGAVYLY